MLQPKKGFENTDVSYRLGTTRININTNNITQDHIDVAKRYGIDLTMYVEEVEKEVGGILKVTFIQEEVVDVTPIEVPEELLDIQEPIKPKANAKAKTNKRPKRTN